MSRPGDCRSSPVEATHSAQGKVRLVEEPFLYSALPAESALARRPEAVEPDCWKYRPTMGVRKERKMMSAPLQK